jgi:hypothetical protein
MELKKGYTASELSDFMKQTFREKKRARRTKDGGREAYAAIDIEETNAANSSATHPETFEPLRDASEHSALPKGFWERLRDRFRNHVSRRDNEKVNNS